MIWRNIGPKTLFGWSVPFGFWFFLATKTERWIIRPSIWTLDGFGDHCLLELLCFVSCLQVDTLAYRQWLSDEWRGCWLFRDLQGKCFEAQDVCAGIRRWRIAIVFKNRRVLYMHIDVNSVLTPSIVFNYTIVIISICPNCIVAIWHINVQYVATKSRAHQIEEQEGHDEHCTWLGLKLWVCAFLW